MDGVVLATGGGAVLESSSRSHLSGRGFVVYLYTSVEQQLTRTSKGRNVRPLLENTEPSTKLRELLQERDPLYREIADMTVETDGRKVRAVAEEIIEQVS